MLLEMFHKGPVLRRYQHGHWVGGGMKAKYSSDLSEESHVASCAMNQRTESRVLGGRACCSDKAATDFDRVYYGMKYNYREK